MTYPKLFLQKGKEVSLLRKHHWVFSGALAKKEEGIQNGDLVAVYSSKNDFLGIGNYAMGSIMVRIISFEERAIDAAFWTEKIRAAHAVREALHLTQQKETTV